ncbi:hypothetical protein BASA81_007996 [Batrachochytrium salamandrivorans]|nr:hypothetical protein BASA81_007996 [Batrachochytrium salamandrivorans]
MKKKVRSLYCSHVTDQPLPPPGVPPTGWHISISPQEQVLLNVVKNTLVHFNLKTVPRIAGGWVRDKLLNKDCHDIDIALDDCSGEEFANKVNEYLASTGQEVKTVGVIKANPDQSKHLATATVRIHHSDIDFVNLRSETYETHSRIPKIEIGTPEQDAYRRDFTVNSMFYNVLSEQVEDLTKMGLEDLENGVLRTPLDALQTFSDDPLRMLRAVRFSARYGFSLEESLCKSLFDVNNGLALATKISHERVGVEIDKMLRGPLPKLALKMLVHHKLCDAVFKVPMERFIDLTSDKLLTPGRVDWINGLRIVDRIQERSEFNTTPLYLAGLLFPLGTSTFQQGKKREYAAKHVCFANLKLGSYTSDRCFTIITASLELIPFLLRSSSMEDRLLLGRILFEVKDCWRDGLIVAIAALEAGRAFSKDHDLFCQQVKQRAEVLEHCIEHEWDLDLIWDRLQKDPVLDGKELMSLLKIKGAEVRRAVILVREFCFLNSILREDERDLFVERCKRHVLEQWTK